MDEAGLKTARYDGVSAHALRHTAAARMLDACGNVRTVQGFLGHKSLATTNRYVDPADMDAMRAAQRAEPGPSASVVVASAVAAHDDAT